LSFDNNAKTYEPNLVVSRASRGAQPRNRDQKLGAMKVNNVPKIVISMDCVYQGINEK